MKSKHSMLGRTLVLLATIFSFVTLFSGRAAAQNLLQDGGFELGLTTGPSNSVYRTTFGAWSQGAIFVSIHGMPTYGNIPAYEGNETIRLESGTGEIHQSFASAPGVMYRVSLAVCAGTVQVAAFSGATTNLVVNSASPGGTIWGSNSYTFTATGTATTLSIKGVAGGGNPHIDDVRVVGIPIINDGGFELGYTSGPGGYANRTTYGAWSAVGSPHATFLFGMPFNSVPPYEGSEAMFVGDADAAGFVTQSFPTTIGQQYWVSFAINGIAGGVAAASATVSTSTQLNLLANFVSPGGYAWGSASYPFVATATNTNLKIQNIAGYSIVDDVRVTTLPLDMALQFDGVNDYASLTTLGNRLPTTEVTVEFWQRVRSVKAQSTFGLSVDNGANRFQAHVPYSDGNIYWDFGNAGGSGRLSYKPPVSIVGTWQHFALVSSTVGNYMRIYRNGVLEKQKSGHGTFTRVANDLYLGRLGAGGYFDGDLDEFRIWNVARSEAQIRDSLNSRLPSSEAGLVAYHRMDEGSGLALVDATANANNGTLFNGVKRIVSTVPGCGLATFTAVTAGSFTTLTYGGYQGAGIGYVNTDFGAPYVDLNVTNLCYDITPDAGTAGVDLHSIYPNDYLTLNYSGGSWTNLTTDAAGLTVKTIGENGTPGAGNGGNGGNASSTGNSTINSSGAIVTSGSYAQGIVATSQANAGGNGAEGTLATGGNGGRGGGGGYSTVNSTSAITTSGANSPGILALSQGGTGGNGGGGGSFFKGGDGGRGGGGGLATITGSGTISTTGSNSIGVYALSQGGRGGNGGEDASWTSTGTGGTGGGGGNGLFATVDGSWNITTFGADAFGISARSLGGSGGTAQAGGWLAGNGGDGGASGNGSRVIVNLGLGGTIDTWGKNAHGIFAQSLGGFAGSGGTGESIFSASGGDGGSAGRGSSVFVTNRGTIITHGVGANAILAESIGGGGGSGGSGSGLFSGTDAGGTSSAGGNGGGVTVNNLGVLQTSNNFARGVFAQSIGGSGGNGVTDKGAFYSVGGAGGRGGWSGLVTVTNSGQIATAGSDASGIFAQSVGGGGGSGGGAVSAGVFGNGAIGGSGGPGGNGSRVNVYSGAQGSITNSGDRSHGIFAQSVGGGGGNGGFALSGAGGTFAGAVGIGGSGGVAGNASNVLVNSESAIRTGGKNAHGIFAQSVGGGGGSGGYSITVAGAAGGAAALSFGGTGGSGGDGNSVDLTSGGAIQTTGDRSYGILAQSVGGGGGDGGFSIAGSVAGGVAAPFSFGGDGGVGGVGGDVVLNSQSQISTGGKDAHGIFVQSVGGGGGSGGFSVAGGISGGGQAGASFGGKGGSGSSAGNVTVTTGNAINTVGNHSYGILAQSIGGGGGDGGFSVAGGISGSASVNFAMGGSGGAGGVAGNVDLNNSSTITTAGTNSHAIFAQSVGGGGGSGGFSVGAGISGGAAVSAAIGGPGGSGASASNVTVTSSGTLTTSMERSYGILAQSIGGGGGDGGFSVAGGIGSASVSFAMGGSGGAGGVGGNVVINSASSIGTTQRNSHAIFAQSVGGGGGSGGFSVAGGISSGAAISAGIGGNGGSGADAATVAVTSTGTNITTFGDHSYGILAQSIGGGGGDGGFSVAGGISSAPSVNFAMGGSGGVAGDGATVAVTNRSAITTRGQDSHGIFSQSVGGGGGSGGFSVAGGISASGAAISASIGGGGTNGGVAGNVILTNSGAITTTGDRAYGILAQSVGGGGGDGGFSVAGAISQGPAITFSMGGGAGPGGRGANVDVGNNGNIFTGGELAYGIFAQSVGGGGGSGGFSVAGSLSANSGGLGFSLGGSAGSGADAARVNVVNSGNIETTNKGSHAVMAQSVGGGGGAGGFAGALAGGFGDGAKLAVGIGGLGGAGGDGSNVVVRSTGSDIVTRGVASYGIFAQSVGGGGGDGGAGLAASFGTQAKAVNLALAIGRSGGSGGTGGAVTVNNASAIETDGIVSHGIAAQSIGGGGGNGGFSATGTLSTSTNAKQLSVSLGGSGGSGGSAGNVSVTNSGQITTLASVTGGIPDFGTNLANPTIPVGSAGILAQSIGGGGGNGGTAFAGSFAGTGAKNISVAVGGGGGAGNSAGAVTVQNSGVIDTAGTNSHGVLAQSIGGGGGNGGSAISLAAAVVNPSDTWTVNASVSVGGGGGDGGVGGAVKVINSSNIITRGENAHGVFAQSVGGGGGVGGNSLAITGGWNNQNSNTLNASVAFGGAGGNGNHGGAVDVLNNGNIETSKDASYGIFAQSVGGGGGAGGNARALTVMVDPKDWVPGQGYFSGLYKTLNLARGGTGGGASDGGVVSVTNVGSIKTKGADAYGIFAQSVGGGGGGGGEAAHGVPLDFLGSAGSVAADILLEFTPFKSFNATQIVLGGSGGSSGNGSSTIVNNTGIIETLGDGAHAIFAQSIGGGGGIGGKGAVGLVGKVGIGGGGGTSGDGGNVAVIQSGDIITSGMDANGITAQSVGGGGGMGGNVDRGFASANLGINVARGNGGGNGGNGGTVTVASDGNITTSNSASFGIFAQSVGGGGGVAGSIGNLENPILLSFAGSTGGYGDGGAVKVTHSGDITTYGNGADGIFAQSVGGTNKAAVALGVGGAVNITVIGDVTASGTNANGIFAQSTGVNGAGDITINVLGGGTVHGGSGDSAGVRIDGGANNTLTNHGIITTLNGASGVAILGGSGNERVENFGTLVGQVLLGGGANVWNNHPGSMFTVETSLDLGAGNLFDNSGLLTGNGQIVGNVVNGGAIEPGNSAGSLSIEGTLTLLAEARVTFEIGGTQAGVTHDFISVSGSAGFLGTLDLWLTEAFEPASTDTFTLMDYASSSGGFGNVTGGRVLARDNLGSFRISYDVNSLVVDDYQWDTDGDGMDDQDEILAGTDWLLKESVLAISSLTRDASGSMVLRFPRVAGKNYRLEYTRNPAGGAWKEVWWPALTHPDANTAEWIDDGTQTGGLGGPGTFYRVKLQLTTPTEVRLGASIQRNEAGHIVLRFLGVSGNTYAVDYTDDPASGTWTSVASPQFDFPAPGVGQWTDDGTTTGGLSATSRFYRVKLLWTNSGNTPPKTWIKRDAAGNAVLLFAGLPGNGHVVEYTSDPGSGVWTPVVTTEFTFPAPGFSQWIDDGSRTGGDGVPYRFYRVRQQAE